MHNQRPTQQSRFPLSEAARAQVATYLYEVYSAEDGLLGTLDRWSQRRITEENMAKLALIFDSDDPAEAAYRDLVREIDSEAETGIFLAKADSPYRHLRRVVDEPGVSGELHDIVPVVAPVLFADEVSHSNDELDLVWVTIDAHHDRAHVDATVSEIIMSHILGDPNAARDMTNAIRALLYTFHENIVRRRCDLPRRLNERDERELVIMISELAKRTGSYEDRSDEIRQLAETTR
jgi:hypothetical protein